MLYRHCLERSFFWQLKIPPSNDIHSVYALISINDSMSYFDPSALFNRVKPDRVTICDAIRRADAYLFLNIDALSYFLNKLRINIILIISKKHHIFWRWFELLWHIRCRSSTPILKKLAGSLRQDFRLRVHANRAFPPILILRTFESTQLAFHADRNRTCQ